jgi:hypothetical protein
MSEIILSPSQRRALEFLARAPWTAAWWGGKPHGSWPKELNARTYDKLVALGFIGWGAKGAFDRTVKITASGRAALSRPTSAARTQTERGK